MPPYCFVFSSHFIVGFFLLCLGLCHVLYGQIVGMRACHGWEAVCSPTFCLLSASLSVPSLPVSMSCPYWFCSPDLSSTIHNSLRELLGGKWTSIWSHWKQLLSIKYLWVLLTVSSARTPPPGVRTYLTGSVTICLFTFFLLKKMFHDCLWRRSKVAEQGYET